MKIKLLTFILAIFAMATITSCKKEGTSQPSTAIHGCMDPTSSTYNPAATVDDGSCKYTGQAMFWYNSNGSMATVYINGQTGYVTLYYTPSAPGCGASGCATFTLPVGTYTYTAYSSWSSWSGSITVTKGGCAKQVLK